MKCAWNQLLAILPQRFRNQVDKQGREEAQNICLRLGAPPEITLPDKSIWLDDPVSLEDLNFCINSASHYSPWSAATLSQGYISCNGGHRMGICGEAVVKNGVVTGMRDVSSVCIRIARDHMGIAEPLGNIHGSILILGAPGWGKTTLLRDLIRLRSNSGQHVAVVDERKELFPADFDRGKCTEVLFGCPKAEGMDMLLKTMGPEVLAVDEITSQRDCEALTKAAWCGVHLLATAHASGLHDYLHRQVYSPLVTQNLFETIVVLHRDKSWHLERSGAWTTKSSGRY